jgi:hypothetical protein
MLTVTPGARERLTRKLVRKKAGENEAMRFKGAHPFACI